MVYREFTENGKKFNDIMREIAINYFSQERTCNTLVAELEYSKLEKQANIIN